MSRNDHKHLRDVSETEFRDLHFAIKVGLCSALSCPISESIGRIETPVKRHIRECFDVMARRHPDLQMALDDLYAIIIEGKP
jgi:hypothetical protein